MASTGCDELHFTTFMRILDKCYRLEYEIDK